MLGSSTKSCLRAGTLWLEQTCRHTLIVPVVDIQQMSAELILCTKCCAGAKDRPWANKYEIWYLWTPMFTAVLFTLAQRWSITSVHWWMNGYTKGAINAMTYNSALKKEGNSDTCYCVDEAWERYAKWNKPAPEEQILCDFTYRRHLE